MGQRSKRAARCDVCRMQLASCLCAEIPRLTLATRVVLVMHHREVSKTTATGPLALRALTNGELHVHGERDAPLDLTSLHGQGRRVMLLFPSDAARPLTPELLAADRRPVTLVVPDGNWRQASRASRRIRGLAQAEPVALVEGAPSRYRLRREPKEGGLATFEAVARALGVLESADVQIQLETLFARMVERTLDTRGKPATVDATPCAETPPLEIIYRDADLVAVNKPAGMLVHRGWARDGRPALQILRDQLGRHVHPVHRLDRATSGVLLFALSGEVARLVQVQFDAHEVGKRYLALCRGHDPALVQVDHALAKTEGGERRPAVTDFKLLGQFERYGLFEARPRTGRLHQIRRHLKHASHPIIGDARYGKGEHNRLFRERFGFHRLALHASDLALRQPRTGAPLRLHAPVPPELARLFEALGLPPQG
ncbi:MAG TPA: DTW domain-containing protein [Polyangia bacterium]|nr:DTW domain-containing protein [Polyangia bacterium]